MPKIDQIANGEVGSSVRAKINNAEKHLPDVSLLDAANNALTVSNVDDSQGATFKLTTAVTRTQSVPDPTDTADKTKTFTVALSSDSNVGALIIVQGFTLAPGQSIEFKWDGTAFATSKSNTGSELIVATPTGLISNGANLNAGESTSWLTGGTITQNVDPALVDISAGTGLFVDNFTDPLKPVTKPITFGPFVGVAMTNILTQPFTRLLIDENGALVQRFSISREDIREEFALGEVQHGDNATVTAISQFTNIPAIGLGSSVYDFAQAVGDINLTGNLFSSNGANLSIDKDIGTVFTLWFNAKTNLKDPSKIDHPALTLAEFIYTFRDGIGGFKVIPGNTVFNVGDYDDGGAVGAGTVPVGSVGNNQFQINRVFLGQANVVIIQYGQEVYSSIVNAEANIGSEPFDLNPALNDVLLRGWIITRGNATDLSNVAQAKFINAGKFGLSSASVGAGVGDLSTFDLLDVSTVPPTDLAVLTFDILTGQYIPTQAVSSTMTKVDFFALAAKRIRDSEGSGDNHEDVEFLDYYTTPGTVANEITLKQRFRMVNGIEFNVAQITLTLPAASAVFTLVSNQQLIMFDTGTNDITTTDDFFLKCDLSTAAIPWAALPIATKIGHLQDPENNIYSDNGKFIQATYDHIVTNLTQDYLLEDWEQAILDASYTQGTLGDTFIQWTKSGIVAVPLSIIQRRNQGAYEPTFNSNGTAEFGDNLPWFTTTDARATTADCFTSVGDGSIAGAASGRSDGKFFDSINSSDVQDLRMSSKRLPQSEIEVKYERMSEAAEVRGFEGVPFTTMEAGNVGGNTASGGWGVDFTVSASTAILKFNATNPSFTAALKLGDVLALTNGTDSIGLRLKESVTGNAIDCDVIADTGMGTLVASNDFSLFTLLVPVEQLHLQANQSWTDIIGDPVNILATFPNGVEGQWIPKIPDGSAQDLPLQRKAVATPIFWLFTGDNGVSWTNTTASIGGVHNSTLNQINANGTTNTAGRVHLYYYQTQAYFTQDDINSEVLVLGTVFAVNDNNIENGNLLLSSLIDKVGVGDAEPRNLDFNLISNGSIKNGLLDTIAGNEPLHPALILGAITNPAIKTLGYLSSKNNVGQFFMDYKELIYDDTADTPSELTAIDGTISNAVTAGVLYNIDHGAGKVAVKCILTASTTFINLTLVGDTYEDSSGLAVFVLLQTLGWGDNNKFEIADNQETFTDDNGNIGLRGTARLVDNAVKYFIRGA